jgi:hypothetical protein
MQLRNGSQVSPPTSAATAQRAPEPCETSKWYFYWIAAQLFSQEEQDATLKHFEKHFGLVMDSRTFVGPHLGIIEIGLIFAPRSDAAVLTHIGDSSATGQDLQNYALIGAKFTFKGRTAHGGVNPWDGKDAVDAVVLMDIGFDKLREHLRPTYRGHRGPWAKDNFDKLVNIGPGADDRHDHGNGTLRRSLAVTRQQSDRRSDSKEYRNRGHAQVN